MMRHSFVPTDFRFGIIKPLLKCKNGDQSDLSVYRGITLTPVLSKLFESVLLGLYSEHLIKLIDRKIPFHFISLLYNW